MVLADPAGVFAEQALHAGDAFASRYE